jgi:hypothetical protein
MDSRVSKKEKMSRQDFRIDRRRRNHIRRMCCGNLETVAMGMAYRRGSTVVTMGPARDCVNKDTSVTQVQGPPRGGNTPTSCLLSIIFTVVTSLLELFSLEEEEEDGSDSLG